MVKNKDFDIKNLKLKLNQLETKYHQKLCGQISYI